MIIDSKVDQLENSSVKLTITIGKATLKKEYEDLVGKYLKTAQMKGFRKGKIPRSIFEKKYSATLKNEAGMDLLEKGLKTAFETIEKKPLPYSRPVLQDGDGLDFDIEKDITFSVVYDVYPEVDPGNYKGIEIEVPDVAINKKDEEREMEILREQNSVVINKEESAAEKKDIVTINYIELDENEKEKQNTKREDFVFTIGTGYNIYKIDDDIIGMKKDEEKVIEKDFPEDFENKDLAGKKIKLKVKITAVKEKQLPEMDDELAQDISDKYKTIGDLKNDIRNKLEESLELKLREMNVNNILGQLIEKSKIDIPESMIRVESQSNWDSFVRQFKGNEEQALQFLKMQKKTKDALFAEWRPGVIKKSKSSLIVNKIIEKEKIEAADNDIEEHIKKEAERSGMKSEDIRKQIEKNRYMEYIKFDIRNNKVYDLLLKNASLKKGKKMNFLDLLKKNQ